MQNEKVVHLDDFLQRRSLIAMLGYARSDAIGEVAHILADAFGWADSQLNAEIQRMEAILETKHPI